MKKKIIKIHTKTSGIDKIKSQLMKIQKLAESLENEIKKLNEIKITVSFVTN